jgi:hypothetical protein
MSEGRKGENKKRENRKNKKLVLEKGKIRQREGTKRREG